MREPVKEWAIPPQEFRNYVIGGIPEADLALFCPGLQERGATLIDRSQNALDCTIIGPTWKRLPSGLWALSFDGSDDEVYHSLTDTLAPPALTVEAWVKADAFTNAYNSVISYESVGAGYAFLIKSTGKLAVYTASGNYDGSGVATLSAVTWYHLAMTSDATNLIGYVNGVLDKSTASGGLIVPPIGGNYFYVGQNRTVSREWGGDIALERIYRRALTATELLRHYTRERLLFGV